jgi:hypothetical protein
MYNTNAFVQPGGSNSLITVLLPGFLLKSQKQKSADRKHAALAAHFPSTLKAMRKKY